MTKEIAIKLFQEQSVRVHWDDEHEKWYFSIVDIVAILTESINPQAYWRKLKERLKKEGNETVTNCHGLKMKAPDGKMRLTDEITKAWSGLTTKEYKNLKELKKENLRDNMTNLELVLIMLAETSTTELSKKKEPKTLTENKQVAQSGGSVAGNARKDLEKQLGESVVSPLNAKKIHKALENDNETSMIK